METTRIRILLELLEKEIQKIINEVELRPKRKFKRDPGPIDEELLF